MRTSSQQHVRSLCESKFTSHVLTSWQATGVGSESNRNKNHGHTLLLWFQFPSSGCEKVFFSGNDLMQHQFDFLLSQKTLQKAALFAVGSGCQQRQLALTACNRAKVATFPSAQQLSPLDRNHTAACKPGKSQEGCDKDGGLATDDTKLQRSRLDDKPRLKDPSHVLKTPMKYWLFHRDPYGLLQSPA